MAELVHQPYRLWNYMTNNVTERSTKTHAEADAALRDLERRFAGAPQPTDVGNRRRKEHNDAPAVTRDELRAAIRRLNKKSCSDYEGVTPALLKHAAASDAFVDATATYYTRILRGQCAVPDSWRLSVTTFIPKPGSAHGRPIANTSLLSRTFEHVVRGRLEPCFSTLEADGFLRGRSASRALMRVVPKIRRDIENQRMGGSHVNGRQTVRNDLGYLVLFDISDAYTTLSYHDVLQGLQNRGAPQYLIDTVAAWLSDRAVQVAYFDPGGDYRRTRRVYPTRGMPQGAVLSPLLWAAAAASFQLPALHAMSGVNRYQVVYADDIAFIARNYTGFLVGGLPATAEQIEARFGPSFTRF